MADSHVVFENSKRFRSTCVCLRRVSGSSARMNWRNEPLSVCLSVSCIVGARKRRGHGRAKGRANQRDKAGRKRKEIYIFIYKYIKQRKAFRHPDGNRSIGWLSVVLYFFLFSLSSSSFFLGTMLFCKETGSWKRSGSSLFIFLDQNGQIEIVNRIFYCWTIRRHTSKPCVWR